MKLYDILKVNNTLVKFVCYIMEHIIRSLVHTTAIPSCYCKVSTTVFTCFIIGLSVVILPGSVVDLKRQPSSEMKCLRSIPVMLIKLMDDDGESERFSSTRHQNKEHSLLEPSGPLR